MSNCRTLGMGNNKLFILPSSELNRSTWDMDSQKKSLNGDWLIRKVMQDDNLAPFNSDKILADILDLGDGGAHRTLHNLCPKSDIISGNHSHNLAPPRGLG